MDRRIVIGILFLLGMIFGIIVSQKPSGVKEIQDKYEKVRDSLRIERANGKKILLENARLRSESEIREQYWIHVFDSATAADSLELIRWKANLKKYDKLTSKELSEAAIKAYEEYLRNYPNDTLFTK